MEERRAAQKAAIDAADRLFYARGIQAVTMDELRAETGISLKKLYSLFDSKQAILLAVLAHRHELWTSGIARAAGAVSTPRDKLLSVYDFLHGWFTDGNYRGCGFINAFGELGATVPAVALAARKQKDSFQRYVAGLVEQAGAPASLAPQLAILAEGAQTTAAISGSADAAHSARDAAEILIDAALQR
ncbi:TetR/AcrR family transcriptional regulator [Cryobacterium algoritolerans]|uniref:TetR/AcrR family transcriptional regulator n=1 Tax=Cryobacterium algoritolerans TaxID=1259184 RepID=A0A4R8WXD7_9MICO|nr:TetR/AcrR family transcriptional regulator [Cryobacterium algoritolerans]TFC20975.1 TetR/AcrR family transcriptional regulator [Cryobacterium algoritolerans]